MKKVFLVVVSVVMATAVSAQTKLGFRAGASMSELKFNSVTVNGLTLTPQTSDVVDFHTAIVLNLQIPGFIFLQPELQYNTISSKFFMTPTSGIKQKITYSRSSLQVPLMVGFNIGFLKLNAGPVFNLVSDENTSNNSKGLKIESKDIPVGYQVGAGIKIGNMTLEARYASSMEKSKYTFSSNGKSKTASPKDDYQLMFSVGFLF